MGSFCLLRNHFGRAKMELHLSLCAARRRSIVEWFDLIRYSADSTIRSIMGMKDRLLLRRAPKEPAPAYQRTAVKKAMATELVHSRPAHLEESYGIFEDTRQIDQIFTSLRKKLFEDSDALSTLARRGEGGKTVFRETGKTSEGRGYILFKPFNDYGWLIERSGAGWRINRAEKIISQNMFLRSNGDAWDVAVLFADPKRSDFVRVKSQRFGDTLMSMAVYEQRLRSAFQNELIGGTL